MRRCLPSFVLLNCALLPAWGADAPSPAPPACQAALHSLQQAQDQAAAAPQGASAVPRAVTVEHLKALQRRAAVACLGPAAAHAADAPPRSPHVSAAPIALPRPVPLPTLPRAVVAPPAAPAPAPASPRPPLSAAACDAAGCWASDGTRLQRVGPNLVGPHGICTQQGALLSCP